MLDEGDFGGYHGLVIAEDGAGERRVCTRVAAFLEPERFDVTVTHVLAPVPVPAARSIGCVAWVWT